MSKTVKVRVAVGVGSNGQWAAYGPCEDLGLIADSLDDDKGNYPKTERFYYLTAELPIPEVQEIEAEVEEGE